MKTLKEEIIELLMKRIGVAEGEEFAIISIVDRSCVAYKISKGKLFFKNLSEEWSETERWVNFIKDFEEYEFKVIPFRPKIGDWYYHINILGNPVFGGFKHYNTFDCLNRAIGNCFRTKESAEAHKEEILKILKGEGHE